MLSGAAANLNQVTKALTRQPCKTRKTTLQEEIFFQATHSKTSKCTLSQIASPLIICEPGMLLFKGLKNWVSRAQHPVLPKQSPTHLHFPSLSFITHSSSSRSSFKLCRGELAQLFCSSKEAATTSTGDLQLLTPVSWAQRCCEHSTNSAQASHNSCGHHDSSQSQEPKAVIPACAAHRLKKHGVTLRANALFHFLA